MAVSDVQHQKRFEHVVRKQNKTILLDINCLTRGSFCAFSSQGTMTTTSCSLAQSGPPQGHIPGFLPQPRSSGSLQHTVLLVVGLEVLVHAARVCHLLAIDLGQELGIVHPLLLVEQNVGRVRVDLVRVQLLTQGKNTHKNPMG